MDAPDCDPEMLADALEVLDRTGRITGGHRLLRRQVLDLLGSREPRPISILDIGTGGGGGARSLGRTLCGRGWSPAFTLADLHARTLSLCRKRLPGEFRDPYRFVRLDGTHLPFGDRAFDVVVCSLTLHHLEDAEAARLFGEMDRVGRWGWALTDLRRSRLGLAAIRLLAATAWRRHPFPRADGPVSVRRSFTASELRSLLRGASLPRARVEARPMRLAARSVRGEPGTPE